MTGWIIVAMAVTVGGVWAVFVGVEFTRLRREQRQRADAESHRSCDANGPPVPPGEKKLW